MIGNRARACRNRSRPRGVTPVRGFPNPGPGSASRRETRTCRTNCRHRRAGTLRWSGRVADGARLQTVGSRPDVSSNAMWSFCAYAALLLVQDIVRWPMLMRSFSIRKPGCASAPWTITSRPASLPQPLRVARDRVSGNRRRGTPWPRPRRRSRSLSSSSWRGRGGWMPFSANTSRMSCASWLPSENAASNKARRSGSVTGICTIRRLEGIVCRAGGGCFVHGIVENAPVDLEKFAALSAVSGSNSSLHSLVEAAFRAGAEYSWFAPSAQGGQPRCGGHDVSREIGDLLCRRIVRSRR